MEGTQELKVVVEKRPFERDKTHTPQRDGQVPGKASFRGYENGNRGTGREERENTNRRPSEVTKLKEEDRKALITFISHIHKITMESCSQAISEMILKPLWLETWKHSKHLDPNSLQNLLSLVALIPPTSPPLPLPLSYNSVQPSENHPIPTTKSSPKQSSVPWTSNGWRTRSSSERN
eukprot:TRINITY_DN5697_c0_g1_i9.p1 TRINITY_DN5697_c0_g1~~TRINITY_DN5697_c0_g1_i9.p1  ORF type:complete len:178 (+),score=39.58 TRINITY_DN5697_c0_g1_i9:132-665(+)